MLMSMKFAEKSTRQLIEVHVEMIAHLIMTGLYIRTLLT